MLYLQFWSGFANEWAEKNRKGKLDSVVSLAPVQDDTEEETTPEYNYGQNSDVVLKQRASLVIDELSSLLKETGNLKIALQANEKTQGINHYCKYEYMMEYGTQILAIFKSNTDCLYLSRNFFQLTGHNLEEKINDGFLRILHPDFREKFASVLSYSNNFSAPQSLIVRLSHADEKYYWYKFTIHAKGGEFACIIENIHKNIQVQSKLQKAKLEAELALRARSEFLAGMSHELRTPLNAVIGFSQLMESGILGKIANEHHAEYIKNIRESGHDLLAKIEDLLEIADIEAGRISISREEVYVNDLIKQVMQMQEHHAKSKNVRICYQPLGNMLLFVDKPKIQHIIGHLLSNAIKFNKPGGTAKIEIARAENSGIKISVHDDGHGMNYVKCHDIREALQQESCWTANNNNHIGIGLALAKEIAMLHGGTLDIDSRAGIGTSVSITLPRSALRISHVKKEKNPELTKTLEKVF